MKRILSLVFALSFIDSAIAQSTPAFQATSAQSTASSSSKSSNTSTQLSPTSELLFLVEQLQQEVQALRGIVEQQEYQIKQLKQQGRDRYHDLDQRLLKLKESTSSASSNVSPHLNGATYTSAPSGANTVVEGAAALTATSAAGLAKVKTEPSAKQQREYQQAYDLIKQKKYDQAVDELHKFIALYPDSDLAGNAYYWLGEVYLVMPKFEQARQAFTVVVGSFPNHRKAADAMFKLGTTYHRLDNLKDAKFYLTEVVKRYPESSAAKLAKEYITKL
ncbi:tol-pal system protein YbgF [Alkalimarinus alittae]|uniref:Cell division coordinator CpoB n=1 Tax=Alkalimarinus alittae TaxID=2961619 RepID=A0ABY6N696_9ALTE|nr:tol-pal system protein YbgF [Alkalimarinus alittae]UZE97604.1 tol-pal system protein YbgF [Alkalimarinus alittae]